MSVAERGRVLLARDPLRVIACVALCTALAGANSAATTSVSRDRPGKSIGAGGRVVVARIDPTRVHIRLDTAFGGSVAHPSWSIDRAPPAAIVAVNAGQFVGSLPWGWVVLDGHEFLPPGNGPVFTAVVIDSSGDVHWVQSGSLVAARSTAPSITSPLGSRHRDDRGDGRTRLPASRDA